VRAALGCCRSYRAPSAARKCCGRSVTRRVIKNKQLKRRRENVPVLRVVAYSSEWVGSLPCRRVVSTRHALPDRAVVVLVPWQGGQVSRGPARQTLGVALPRTRVRLQHHTRKRERERCCYDCWQWQWRSTLNTTGHDRSISSSACVQLAVDNNDFTTY
jgi:hypothetical protein